MKPKIKVQFSRLEAQFHGNKPHPSPEQEEDNGNNEPEKDKQDHLERQLSICPLGPLISRVWEGREAKSLRLPIT